MDFTRKYLGFIVVLGIIFISAGCGGGGGTSGGTAPAVPSIKNISVPETVSSNGETITIQASITCRNPIVGVTVEIRTPDSTIVSFPIYNEVNSNVYSGTYDVPENTSGNPQGYEVKITANDSNGNTTSKDVAFQVLASSTPPGPPPDPI